MNSLNLSQPTNYNKAKTISKKKRMKGEMDRANLSNELTLQLLLFAELELFVRVQQYNAISSPKNRAINCPLAQILSDQTEYIYIYIYISKDN